MRGQGLREGPNPSDQNDVGSQQRDRTGRPFALADRCLRRLGEPVDLCHEEKRWQQGPADLNERVAGEERRALPCEDAMREGAPGARNDGGAPRDGKLTIRRAFIPVSLRTMVARARPGGGFAVAE